MVVRRRTADLRRRLDAPQLDKFKQMIPDVIRTGQEIEIYAGEFGDMFEAKERELNRLYNPPWVDRHG